MPALVSVDVTVDGKPVEQGNLVSVVVDRDMFQPDMAAIVVSNQDSIYSGKVKIGAVLEVKVGKDQQSIYKGEVVGLEATYKGGEKSKVLIRGMNKLHRLLRKRKSVTFADKTDQQIVNQVVGDAGLSLEWKHEKSISYKHVYQHNLTDLEFLRMRAARLGCHVWCVDSKVFVKQPDLTRKPLAKLKVADTEEGDTAGMTAIKMFTPRLSSAAVVNQVTVKGWNPEKKELITGVATIQKSKLGADHAVAASGSLANEETFTVDHPIWSAEEAAALAKARLQDLALSYITGECEVDGDAIYELGGIVEILSNTEAETKKDDPFNGNYYIMGLTHRYAVSRSSGGGGFTTTLKLARDAAKGENVP
jgi:phage protein D